MTLLKEKEIKSISFSSLLLLLGIVGIFANASHQIRSTYFGQKLITMKCTLRNLPQYIGGGKITNRFSFNSNEFSAKLWIVGTAITEFKKNTAIINPFFKIGDTIEIQIENDAVKLANNRNNEIYVWGLKYKDYQIINPKTIELHDRYWLYIIYLVCTISIIWGLVIKIVKRIKRDNPH